MDVQGKTLQEWTVEAEQISSLDLSKYPAGVYWLKANTQDWEAGNQPLQAVGGSRKLAVERLGISERTLRYKLQQYRDEGFLNE